MGNLELNELQSLSDAAEECLTKLEGKFSLDGLTSLPEGSVKGPYLDVACGTCQTVELSKIAAGESYESIRSCMESTN